jgi:ankyrin repeat protein
MKKPSLHTLSCVHVANTKIPTADPDPYHEHESGWSALHYAAYNSKVEVLRYLTPGWVPSYIDGLWLNYDGSTPLHTSISSYFISDRTFECIDILLGCGLDIHEQDDYGKTALHRVGDRDELVVYMLGKGGRLSLIIAASRY